MADDKIRKDWFDATQAQPAFYDNGVMRIVKHDKVFADRNYIMAASGLRHADGAELLSVHADKSFDRLSDAFNHAYRHKLVEADNHMWLINLIKKEDAGNNDTNSQIPHLYVHMLSGPLLTEHEFIAGERNFHSHPCSDFYQAFNNVKNDAPGIVFGDGNVVGKLVPPALSEAKTHYLVINEQYPSFADFMAQAQPQEKRQFWQTVSRLALPLVKHFKGARIGCYNIDAAADSGMGHMVVEIAGGENLGRDGKNRWFQKAAL